MVKAANGGVLPKAPRGLPALSRFPEKIENVIQIDIFHKFLYYMKEDESAEVVGMAIDVFVDLIK